MPKAYWIARVDVSDPEGYKAYVAANAAAFKKFGARFLVRGAPATLVEGAARQRNVVIEFADYDTAVACFESPEYQAALKIRRDVSVADVIIIEGYDGPQPGDA